MAMSFGGQPLRLPDEVFQFCINHGLPTTAFRGKANRFTCPLGPSPSNGLLIMQRRDFAKLNINQLQPLTMADGSYTVTFPSILIIRSVDAISGQPNDPNTPVMVEITDKRWLVLNTPIAQSFNIRTGVVSPAYFPYSTFAPSIPWTWTTMVNYIWGLMPELGAFPGLPYLPVNLPEGWSFEGVSAYSALNQVLNRLTCALQYDPVADTFGIVVLGAANAAYTTAANKWAFLIDIDDEVLDGVEATEPAKARVFFRTMALDGSGAPLIYSIDVPNPSPAGTDPNSFFILYNDLYATYLLGALTDGAATIAAADEQAGLYFTLVDDPAKRLRRVYREPLSDFRPGYLTGVSWYDVHGGDMGGLQTETFRQPDLLQTQLPSGFNVPQTNITNPPPIYATVANIRIEKCAFTGSSFIGENSFLYLGYTQITDATTIPPTQTDNLPVWVYSKNCIGLLTDRDYVGELNGTLIATDCNLDDEGDEDEEGSIFTNQVLPLYLVKSLGPMPAQILARSQTKYKWREQDFEADGQYEDRPCGASGTIETDTAYEKSLNPNVPVDTYVNLFPGFGSCREGDMDYRFDYCCGNEAPSGSGSGSGAGGVGVSCGSCTIAPLQWAVPVSGLTNGTCTDCSLLNNNFLISYTGSGCVWTFFVPFTCDLKIGGGGEIELQYIAGTDTWKLTFPGVSGPSATYTLIGASWSCMGANTMVLLSSGPECANWPLSITISPE